MNMQNMIRQQGIPHLQQSMLGMNNHNHLFNPQQGQQQQPQQQQQQQQPHMSMLQNNQNPSMALLGQPPDYRLQVQQAQQQRQRAALLQQANNAQGGLNNPNPQPPQQVNPLSSHQLQGLPFSPQNHIPQQQVRRVPSQPQLNQSAPHLGPLHNQSMVQGIPNLSSMALSQQSMQQQIRPPQQPPIGMRMGQQPQQVQMQQQNQLSNDPMHIGLARQHIPGAPGIPPHARTNSAQAQMISNLQPSMQSNHPPGMPPNLHQQPFPNAMSLQQHQQPHLANSPHISQMQGPIPNSLPVGTQGPQQATAIPRARISPENPAMFLNFSNNQQAMSHNPPRMQPNPPFPFVPSSESHLDGIPHNMGQGHIGTPGAATRSNPNTIMTTPAQAFEQMTQGNPDSFSFNLPQQPSVPPRPPSQQQHPPHPGFPVSNQPPQSMNVHHSPRQHDHLGNPHMQVQRPQSQPQVPQRQSPQSTGPSRTTPRLQQQPLPTGSLLPPNAQRPGGPPGQPQGVSAPGAQAPSAPQTPATPALPQATPRQQPAQPPPHAAAPTAPTTQPPTAAPTGGPQSMEGVQPPPVPPPSTAAVANPTPNRPAAPTLYLPIGFGQGISRLLQFSGVLSAEGKNYEQKLTLPYWENLIKEYFTPKAILKFTLWKDNQRNEAKPFEIGVPILSRFFLVTSQSGVKSMNFSLDGARERLMGQGHAVVECVHAVWTYKYVNGYTVTLRGPMTAHILVTPHTSPGPNAAGSYSLKFDQLQFDANYYDKLLSVDSIIGIKVNDSPSTPHLRSLPGMNGIVNGRRTTEDDAGRYDEARYVMEKASLPTEPVNAFGIPQATMRCLELAESVAQMSDLIQFSTENQLGPIEALSQYARKLREAQAGAPNGTNHHPPLGGGGAGPSGNGGSSGTGRGPTPGPGGAGAPPGSGGGVGGGPGVGGAPGINGTPHQAHTPHTPQNGGSPDGLKQNKTTPTMSSSSVTQGSTPNSGPANASTPVGTPTSITTPSLANATLKRKATTSDATSPTSSSDQGPPSKRSSRKRGRTQGGG